MKSGWILGIGALFCTAIVILSRIWLPYGDTGVDTGAYYHVAATVGVLVSIMLFFGHLGMGFQKSDGSPVSESYGSLVTSSYLGLSAMTTTALFIGTYWGLHYTMFWAVQVAQLVGIGAVWVISTKAVVPMALAREGNAKVVGIRKQGLIDALLDASSACQQMESESAKTLKKAIDNLQDELKFLPNHATGAQVDQLMSELNGLVQEINVAVKSPLVEDQLKVLFSELSRKVKATQRHVTQWKRA